MTKQNLQYPHEDTDTDTLKGLTRTSKTEFHAYDSQIAGTGDLVNAWTMYTVHEALSPMMRNEVTKGSHAEGRSISGTDSEATVDATPKETFFIRPNGDKYYHRPWGNSHNDVEVLRAARISNHYPLLYGAPGTGKTAMAEAAYGDELVTIIGTGDTEVADFVGGYIQDAEGAFIWVDGPLVKAAEEGLPFLVDEIGLIDPKVMSLAYGLMDGRRELTVTANPARGTIKAKEGFFVVAATNPNAPGVRLSEALLSRFTLHVEVATDYAMAQTLGVDKHIVAISKALDHQTRQGLVEWAPQMRELLAFRDIQKAFGRDFAIQNLIAAAPETARQEFINTIKKSAIGSTYSAARIG